MQFTLILRSYSFSLSTSTSVLIWKEKTLVHFDWNSNFCGGTHDRKTFELSFKFTKKPHRRWRVPSSYQYFSYKQFRLYLFIIFFLARNNPDLMLSNILFYVFLREKSSKSFFFFSFFFPPLSFEKSNTFSSHYETTQIADSLFVIPF